MKSMGKGMPNCFCLRDIDGWHLLLILNHEEENNLSGLSAYVRNEKEEEKRKKISDTLRVLLEVQVSW